MLRLWRSPTVRKLKWFMVAQVHDEVIMEGPIGTQVEAVQHIIDLMQDPLGGGVCPYYLDKEHKLYGGQLRVDLPVSHSVAHTWHETMRLKPHGIYSRSSGKTLYDHKPPGLLTDRYIGARGPGTAFEDDKLFWALRPDLTAGPIGTPDDRELREVVARPV